MTDLQHWVAQQLRCDLDTVVLEPASADASFRRYYRLRRDRESLIVMDASAEAASCKPFIRIAQMLAGAGLHVPQIIAAAPERGWIVLSDLGTQTYLDVINGDNADRLFDAAIDALIAQQKVVCPADFPQYDAALLRRELELFPDWYLQKHLRIDIDANLRAELDTIFDLLIEQILRQPRVFVHRDFMPRNLMISDPLPGVLDFQDAVCGPIAYDPICLFKDAFVSWPEERVEHWLQIYWERARKAQLP
ncbi:MAG TPA: phosphotransferase, partial [Spongiibacteraceae bacterium]|nr:phosphotransferase [Spongiibacteraceae bacterium]